MPVEVEVAAPAEADTALAWRAGLRTAEVAAPVEADTASAWHACLRPVEVAASDDADRAAAWRAAAACPLVTIPGAGTATAVLPKPVAAAVLRVVRLLLSLSCCTVPPLGSAMPGTADLQVEPGVAVLRWKTAVGGLDLIGPAPKGGDPCAAAGR